MRLVAMDWKFNVVSKTHIFFAFKVELGHDFSVGLNISETENSGVF